MLRAAYWFYISKFIDFFDTIFFVLRKKNNQITMLHIIHHGLLPMSVWPGVRFTSGGQATFFAFLNTLVHIVMYFYYFVAAMGPRYQKYLGWKKYLTIFQMIQFIAASLHCFQLIFVECDFPIAFCWWIGGHELVFLFLKFYKKTYIKEKIIWKLSTLEYARWAQQKCKILILFPTISSTLNFQMSPMCSMYLYLIMLMTQ